MAIGIVVLYFLLLRRKMARQRMVDRRISIVSVAMADDPASSSTVSSSPSIDWSGSVRYTCTYVAIYILDQRLHIVVLPAL